MLFEKRFELMTDDELRLASVTLFSEYKRTGNEQYEREIDRIERLRIARMKRASAQEGRR
jgi:hypothetical protein